MSILGAGEIFGGVAGGIGPQPGTVNLVGQVDPTGTVAADGVINAAITALGSTGGTVLLPTNPAGGQASFRCNNPILIGNGTTTTTSTVNGVRLVGAAPPGSVISNTAPVRLFAGAALSQLVVVTGPCFGNGLSNLFLDPAGQMTNGTMLTLSSAQVGDFSNVSLRVPGGGTGILETIVTGAVANQNTMHNMWRQIYITFANTNTCLAWNFTGSGGSFNTCYESVDGCYIAWQAAASANTITAVQFQDCDNIRMRNLHMNSYTAVGTNRGVFLDYSVRAAKPSDCYIDTVDFGSASTTFANNGTPTAATLNRIVAISATNGQPANPALTNLGYGYANSAP